MFDGFLSWLHPHLRWIGPEVDLGEQRPGQRLWGGPLPWRPRWVGDSPAPRCWKIDQEIKTQKITKCDVVERCIQHMAGWWFGTFFIFPYIGNNHPNWLIFFRGVQTTNQWCRERCIQHMAFWQLDVQVDGIGFPEILQDTSETPWIFVWNLWRSPEKNVPVNPGINCTADWVNHPRIHLFANWRILAFA